MRIVWLIYYTTVQNSTYTYFDILYSNACFMYICVTTVDRLRDGRRFLERRALSGLLHDHCLRPAQVQYGVWYSLHYLLLLYIYYSSYTLHTIVCNIYHSLQCSDYFSPMFYLRGFRKADIKPVMNTSKDDENYYGSNHHHHHCEEGRSTNTTANTPGKVRASESSATTTTATTTTTTSQPSSRKVAAGLSTPTRYTVTATANTGVTRSGRKFTSTAGKWMLHILYLLLCV